uniref:Uncharacterized protein n=1 Tax=Spongospora subterranea TaxID=70186 RepID=A0A0H5RA73_9EUKA|eukprot:CRZ11050.1 hypothetical protein [Spongospora subterranea]
MQATRDNEAERGYASSSSDSESCVDSRCEEVITPPAENELVPEANSEQDEPKIPVEADFWMTTRQAQCGANLSERMATFMKAVTLAQSEFAEKLAAISAGELARAKPASDDAAVYQEYWVQLQLAMRLCRTWSQSSKEMSASISQLLTPMDRIVHAGRSRLKESAVWNVELNKALSVFHTNVAKRQAKCYKALSVVMTPEYFDQSPARKSHAVRRAAPTVTKYVEQIEEANTWISKYMSQRPVLKNRLEALELKRIDITRNALKTFASQVKTMGNVMAESADEIMNGVANIDDEVCRLSFINSCSLMPTPHLENPALFQYTLPVPITELGIRPVRQPRIHQANPNVARDDVFEAAPDRQASSSVASDASEENSAIGKRLSSFANMMFGGQQQQQQSNRPQKTASKTMTMTASVVDEAEMASDILDNDDDAHAVERTVGMAMASEQPTRFGNIVVRSELPKTGVTAPMQAIIKARRVHDVSDAAPIA